jgi:hypothetical protein
VGFAHVACITAQVYTAKVFAQLVRFSRIPLLTAFALVSLVLLSPASSAGMEPEPGHVGAEAGAGLPTLEQFRGSFRYVGGTRGQERAWAAVEDSTAELNDLVKPMARKLLHSAVTAPAVFEVDITKSSIALGASDKKLLTAPADGSPRRWMGPDGGIYKVTHKFADGRLRAHIVGLTNSSTTSKVYTLSADGERLTIRVTIKHKMLPKVLRYQHTYRRT